MSDISEIIRLVQDQGTDLKTWREKQDAKYAELEQGMTELQKKANRPQADNAEPAAKAESWIDVKTHETIPVLTHAQSLSNPQKKAQTPSMGRVLRGLVLGGRAPDAKHLEEERKAMSIGYDPGGGYTVSGVLANEWIDLLRANMVLSKAGARTVPMTSNSLTLARVTGDPTISWHGENSAITASDATLGAMTLYAKTVVCLVKLSLELSQDSANIEQILATTITNAMANAIDSAGLNGVDAGPSGVINLAGRNSVTGIGAPTSWDFAIDGMYELMADNVPAERIGAMVAHPALWKKMAKLKTGITNDKTTLVMPDEVAKLPKLWTTAAPLESGTTATAVIADWRDLLFGVRQDINVRVLQETFLGSNLQIAVLAYARVDFGATRRDSFVTLEGITV